MLEINKIYCMDCVEGMKLLDTESIDLILTDLPYGTTQNKWDSIIPFEPMWKEVKRVLKSKGCFVTTSSQPFTTKLISSNMDWFRYDLIWEKQSPKGFFNARRQPLRSHEEILVFSKKAAPYYPQGIVQVSVNNSRKNKGGTGYGKIGSDKYINTEGNFPRSVLHFDTIAHGNVHPSQKPASLFEYLVRTFSQENTTVLDLCAGSGTTALACLKSKRNFIGFENDEKYFALANTRIAKYAPDL